MCGIAGIVGTAAEAVRADRMCDRQRHRGPDDEGRFGDRALTLAHTRLRVLDLSRLGRQPMQSPVGRHVLVYNGEVYNFRSLRDRLRDLGHTFRSESDSEVVLKAWAEWGPTSVERLEGMFAFAVWDREERRLHLARDRLGIKPLYWHHDGKGSFVFASEVRALLASGLVPRTLDRAALPRFLSQQTVPTPRTLVEGVRMLPPATLMRVELHGGRASAPEIRRWWDPLAEAERRRDAGNGLDRRTAVRGLRERLEAAVGQRLVADVPLGAFLSGGVDSTAVVGLMTRVSDAPVRTFTVAFEEVGYEDGPYARLAAEELGTDHREIRLSDRELVESVPDAVSAQDHPSGDGVNTWIVSRAAKEAGLTVALSGLGGDELFGGYSSFRRLLALHRARPLMRMVPGSLRGASGALVRRLRPGITTEKLGELLRTDGSVPEAYPILREVFSPGQVAALLASGARAWNGERPYTALLRGAFRERPSTPCLARVAYAETSCYMRDVLLRDTDQMSMAHSLEVRVPFLDRELVEYALALPEEARRPSSPPKRYLVEAVGDLLPGPVARRPKSGFAMPFDRWMRGPLKGFCEKGINAVAANVAFRADAVRGVWRTFLADDGRMPWSRPWLLVALGHWLEREGARGDLHDQPSGAPNQAP